MMSDEYGDPADRVGDGGAAPLEPALASRLDTMHRTLSTLGTRIDALVTSTTTYRSALTDRLNEYTELVSKLTRAQAADLEEHRRANDRAAADLRQGLTSSEQALERVSARIEAMAGGAGGGDSEQLLAELRTVRDAQAQMGRSLAEIQESLLDVASGEVMGALWDEFRGTRAAIDEMRLAVERSEEASRSAAEAGPTDATGSDDLEPLRADVNSLTDAVRDLLEQAEVVDEVGEPADLPMLNAVATDVASLRNELARGLVVEPSDALTGAVDQLRADVAGLDARLAAITDLQEAVADLRGAVAEVAATPPVEDTGPDPTLVRVDEGVRDLSQGVADLDARVAALAEQVAAVPEVPVEEDRGPDPTLVRVDEGVRDLSQALADLDARLAALAEQVAAEPEEPAETDGTAEELRSVRDRVAALGERLDSIAVLQEAVTSLRDEVRSGAAAGPEPAALSEELEVELTTLRRGVDAVDSELRTVRSGVEDIIARLDDGLLIADEIAPPPPAVPAEVADRIAALRDEVSTGFDSLRGLAEAAEPVPPADVDLGPVTELLEHLRDDVAALPGRIEIPEPAPPPLPAPAPAPEGDRFATLDPDVVDLLREEIRAAGALPEDLLDQLRKELVALRRRIKLRAEGEVLTDDQLALIAEAVARRLAE